MRTLTFHRRYLAMLLLSAVGAANTGCYIHSPLQEEMAKDVQAQYKLVSPSALQALETLDSDLDRLVESQRADFEIYKETTENVLINMRWLAYRDQITSLRKTFYPLALTQNCVEPRAIAVIKQCINIENSAAHELDTRIKELDGILKSLNTAINKAEANPTLPEKLADAKQAINAALGTIDAALKDPTSPLAKRLSQSVGEVGKFVAQLTEKDKDKDQNKRVFSLVIEAMRLGRDITSLEKEAVEQEQNYHQRVMANFQAMQDVLPRESQLIKMLSDHPAGSYPDNEMIRERLAVLARQASRDEETAAASEQEAATDRQQTTRLERDGMQANEAARNSHAANRPASLRKAAELRANAYALRRRVQTLASVAAQSLKNAETERENMRQILQNLAGLQAIKLTSEMRLKELDLRRAAENYRNAKLKDVIYERQRTTLISYGLDGVVRYSQGGLRSEDITSLINIARLIAEVVIAVRV